MKPAVLVVFLLAYAGIVSWREKALFFLYGAVVLFLAMGAAALRDLPGFLNYNVLAIFLGTGILSYLFSYSRVPAHFVEKIEERRYPVGIVFLLICVITGAVSAFVENVATILIMAPVALEYTRRYKLNPVPLFVGMSISSNLQGCATMVGDSPSIILAMQSGMNFNDFFYMPAAKLGTSHGRPGLFFLVQFGALLSFAVLYLFFRGNREIHQLDRESETVRGWTPSALLVLMIVLLAFTSFLQDRFAFFPAVICLFLGIAGMVWFKLVHREEMPLKHVDWESFLVLVGIFLLVGTLSKAGFIEDLANVLVRTGQRSPLGLFLIIVWMSVLVSAFVDNIPYTVAMIPCIQILSRGLHVNPFVYLFGLLLGTCIGGNITPIGASCNVVAVGIMRKNGYRVSFPDFVRMGLPFTAAAIIGSSLLLWLLYRP